MRQIINPPGISVMDYGAYNDGTHATETTAAVVAAEASLATGDFGGGTIYFPPGTYLITSWTPIRKNLTIRGAGQLATKIKGSGAGAFVIKFTALSRIAVEDLIIDGNNIKTSAMVIGTGAFASSTFKNIMFTGGTTKTVLIGDDTTNSDISELVFIDCALNGSITGSESVTSVLELHGTNTTGINFYGGRISTGSSSTGVAVDIYKGGLWLFGVNLLALDPGYAITARSGTVYIYGGHAEAGGLIHTLSTDPQSDTTTSPHFISGMTPAVPTGSNFIYHEASRSLVVQNIRSGGDIRVGTAGTVRASNISFSGGADFIKEGSGIIVSADSLKGKAYTGALGINVATPNGASIEVNDAGVGTANQNFSIVGLAHGALDYAPTNVFLALANTGASGGALSRGLSSGASITPYEFMGIFGNTNPTDTVPAILFRGAKKGGGAGVVDLAAAETVFQVQNNATNLVTMLGSGNVGVGTTTPGYPLEVISSAAVTASGSTPVFTFDHKGETPATSIIRFKNDGTSVAEFGTDFDGTGADNFYLWNQSSPTTVDFYTGTNTLRASIIAGSSGFGLYGDNGAGITIAPTTNNIQIATGFSVGGDVGTSVKVLHGAASGPPIWGAIGLTTDVTGLLPVANGGTGAATTSQNFVFVGPTSGSGAPAFRALVAGDIPAGSGSYWTYSSPSLYPNNSGDNVIIGGSTNPNTDKFRVVGTQTIALASASPVLSFDHTGETALTSIIRFKDDGTAKAEFGVDFSGTAADNFYLWNQSSPAQLDFYTGTDTLRGSIIPGSAGMAIYGDNGAGITIAPTTNNVGVLTSVAGYPLEVTGNAKISGNLGLAGASPSYPATISTTTAAHGLDVTEARTSGTNYGGVIRATGSGADFNAALDLIASGATNNYALFAETGLNVLGSSALSGAAFPLQIRSTSTGGIAFATSDYNGTDTGSIFKMSFSGSSGDRQTKLSALVAGGTAEGTLYLQPAAGTVLIGGPVSFASDTGTSTKVLHGAASGPPTYSSVSISADVSGLGTGVATFLGTPSSANLRAALTDESGTGAALFANGNIGDATGTTLALGGALATSNVLTARFNDGGSTWVPVIGIYNDSGGANDYEWGKLTINDFNLKNVNNGYYAINFSNQGTYSQVWTAGSLGVGTSTDPGQNNARIAGTLYMGGNIVYTSDAVANIGTAATSSGTRPNNVFVKNSVTVGDATGGAVANAANIAGNYLVNNVAISQVHFGAIGGSIGASTTTYFALGDATTNGTEATIRGVLPKAATVRNLYVYTTTTQPASGTLILTLFKNGSASALTLSIAAGATSAAFADTTHSVAFAAGDQISLRVVNNGTATSAVMSGWAVTLDITQ